jgi:hypothetical protein
MGVTGGQTLWGPGKQRILDSLDFQGQIGFRQASTFAMVRNNEPVLASNGADIAAVDSDVETARQGEKSGLFWLGFDIATGLFGDRPKGLQHTSMGPGAEKIRSDMAKIEHVLLPSDEVLGGFNASVAFHLGRRRK